MNAYRQQQLQTPKLYRYNGIIYTYSDFIQAHRIQQLAIQAAIDCGNYNAAIENAHIDVREFLPQMSAPERSEPQHTKPKRKRKRKLFRIIRRLLE